MGMLTNILYWLSTGMLVPVILLLLLCFGWALALIGGLYGDFARLLRARSSTQEAASQAQSGMCGIDWHALLHPDSNLRPALQALQKVNWHEVHGDKAICDFEQSCRRSVDSAVLLMRVGPMLGLMGTLIPMGPALVGLAAGDMASMAANMQVAFSTTVLGIFVGAVGLVVQLVKKRWYQADSELLRYLHEVEMCNAMPATSCACHAAHDKEAAA